MKSMVRGIHAAISPPKAEQNTENTSATRKKARKLYFIRQRGADPKGLVSFLYRMS